MGTQLDMNDSLSGRTCEMCGGTLYKKKHTKYMYVCPNCWYQINISNGIRDFTREYYLNEYGQYYFDNDDGPEEGCRACGNPAWPNCKTSCPMYDD
jgi:hypothetical protein